MAAVVTIAGLQLIGTTDAHASTPCADSASSVAAAMSAAVACGGRVEDLSQRSATGQVFANADGTLTSVESAQPRFVRSAAGGWVPADPTLIFNTDGSVSPKAASFAMTFSGGGASTPLMSAAKQGKNLSVGWPAGLPRPTLNGSIATYADVLPGVDLQITAQADSFSDVLVVKSPAAANNPALAKLAFALSAPGLTVGRDVQGGLSVSDGSGELFAGGRPRMWDSSTAPGDPAAGDTVQSGPLGPGRGAHVADMPMDVTATQLSVTPVVSMLTDPGTQFPVFIDPSIGLTSWTMINSTSPNQSYWSYDRSDCPSNFPGLQCAKVGYADSGPVVTYRSLFRFASSAYVGTHVLSATFSLDELHSWSCSNTQADLHIVNDTLVS